MGRWLKRFVVGAGILLAVLVALPFVLPLRAWIAPVEQAVSDRLGEPVAIGDVGGRLVPVPRLAIRDVTVGTAPDIRIGEIGIVPALTSLFGSDRVIRSVSIDDVRATPAGFEKLSALAGGEGSGPAPVRVERVLVTNLHVELPQAKVGPLEAEATLGASGALSSAEVRTADEKLRARVVPEEKAFRIDVEGTKTALPVGPAVMLDTLSARVLASADHVALQNLSATLYGGSLTGKGTLDLRKGARLAADAQFSGIGLKELVAVFTAGNRLTGALNGRAMITGRADTLAKLADALRIESTFDIHNGVLYGVDIAEAAKSMIKGGSKGGETSFDELSGAVVAERGAYRLRGVRASSGVLTASGNVDIGASRALSGRIQAGLKAGISLAEVPLEVSGTLQDPVLRPTGSAVAGAVAGTAVLGPGLGTSLGLKAGAAFDRLFGKKP